ncbi:MAG: tetratricopeptide repeat protein, partial [Candidatus Wallbacteria bacterium]|nr:tetratricopeptide repeat protein [Candidatus Wallbacteria bacterium]
LAYARLKSGLLQEAGEIFRRIKPDEENADYQALKGITLLNANDRMNGIKALEKATAIDPVNIKALMALADYYIQMADFGKSTAFLQIIIKEEPFHEDACLALGGIFERQGQTAKAVELYLQFYKRGIVTAELAEKLGNVLEQRDELAQAVEVFRRGADAAVDETVKARLKDRANRLNEKLFDRANSSKSSSANPSDLSDSSSY